MAGRNELPKRSDRRPERIEFVRGNSDLMPEVRKRLKDWKYKPYIYRGHPVELETTIEIRFDPLGV